MMTWSIRSRLTAWYSFVMVVVLVTGAVAVAVVQDRLAYERLDGELERLMLTLEGVMRTEFGEGLEGRCRGGSQYRSGRARSHVAAASPRR